MSNVNTINGWYNLPAQVVSSGTETTLAVPATGLYPSLPSPVFAAGNGLSAGINADLSANMTYGGHPFRVRVVGRLNTGVSSTVTLKLYQVPGSIVSAGTSGTVANDNVVVALTASSAFTGAANFVVEAEFIWDSVSGKLNGVVTLASVNNTITVANGGTAGVLTATTQVSGAGLGDMNFIPSVTFGTANAANSITVTEFVIDRS